MAEQQLFVARKDMTLSGIKVNVGQICQPSGARNDHMIFVGDGSRWAVPFRGDSPIPCDTDGCPHNFDNLGNLQRHRDLVHKPERDQRAITKAQAMRAAQEREEAGETIGGHPVTKTKKGPRGDVSYIEPFG